MTRLAEPGIRRLGLTNWLLWRLLSKGAGVRNGQIFAALGQTRGLFRAWLHFSAKLMPLGTLPRTDTEAVILRVAELRQCDYEREHHARIAGKLGMSEALQGQIREGQEAFAVDDRLHTIIAATDALVRDGDLNDRLWADLSKLYSARQVVEFCLLVGHYNALATTIRTLRIGSDFPTEATR